MIQLDALHPPISMEVEPLSTVIWVTYTGVSAFAEALILSTPYITSYVLAAQCCGTSPWHTRNDVGFAPSRHVWS
jgi:hypothetical protein